MRMKQMHKLAVLYLSENCQKWIPAIQGLRFLPLWTFFGQLEGFQAIMYLLPILLKRSQPYAVVWIKVMFYSCIVLCFSSELNLQQWCASRLHETERMIKASLQFFQLNAVFQRARSKWIAKSLDLRPRTICMWWPPEQVRKGCCQAGYSFSEGQVNSEWQVSPSMSSQVRAVA